MKEGTRVIVDNDNIDLDEPVVSGLYPIDDRNAMIGFIDDNWIETGTIEECMTLVAGPTVYVTPGFTTDEDGKKILAAKVFNNRDEAEKFADEQVPVPSEYEDNDEDSYSDGDEQPQVSGDYL